ncbi:Holliday junction branch migration protein RuvA [Candidatus Saccharibacteria bacterium]|nr:Holliday junction branch migration protein RuvA [Candidatus Saccharibacteria bacterium]
MIAILTGVIAEKIGELVVVDVHGVGYGLLIPTEDSSKLHTGDEAKFYLHEHIRENSHDLYGFTRLDTKNLFEQLLNVTGVGPKMALNILGIGSAENVRSAIAAGDTKFLVAAPGVGKRVAERVVVELKDKVGLVATASDSLFVATTYAEKDEAVQALVALGFTISDAVTSLSGVDAKLSLEERVKQALKGSAL